MIIIIIVVIITITAISLIRCYVNLFQENRGRQARDVHVHWQILGNEKRSGIFINGISKAVVITQQVRIAIYGFIRTIQFVHI